MGYRAHGLAPHLDGTGLDFQRRVKAAGGIAEGGFNGGVGKRECIAQGVQLSACGLYFCR